MSDAVRLLIVNPEYPPVGGGAGNAGRFLALGLARAGHDVTVLTSACGEHRGERVEDGIRVVRVPTSRRRVDRAGLVQMIAFAVSSTLRVATWGRRHRPDGVIAFFTLPSGLAAYSLRRRWGTPFVVSLRGGDVPGLVPELAGAHRSSRWLRRRVLDAAAAVIANSRGLAELSEENDPVAVEVIPNAVDTHLFRPATTPAPGGDDRPFEILFAGRLQRQKNLALLLEETARLVSDGHRLALHVAGAGPLGPALRRRAEELGIGSDSDSESSVTWHGWLDKAALVPLYQSADCFVSPSLYEGSPNTVLEAMACGLPVIASRIAGNDTLLRHGETGLLVDLTTPQRLGEAILELARDRTAARRLGAAGREAVERRPSWDDIAASYAEHFATPGD